MTTDLVIGAKITDIERAEITNALVRTDDGDTIIREQFGLQKATEGELQLLWKVAERWQLDPLSRQIYGIMQWDARASREKMIVVVGIDGYRSQAARTREYAGSDDIQYGPTSSAGFPEWARCTVWRLVSGHRVSFTATVRWDERVKRKKDGSVFAMWQQQPFGQLGKCAEAAALRKGFPAELRDAYVDTEVSGDLVEHNPGEFNDKPVELIDDERVNILVQLRRLAKNGADLTAAKRAAEAVAVTEFENTANSFLKYAVDHGRTSEANKEYLLTQILVDEPSAAVVENAVDQFLDPTGGEPE